MRVVLKPPEDLKQREFNFVNCISQCDGAAQFSDNMVDAGLPPEETMSNEQWVGKLVNELRDAALK
eukprot:9053625-Alexandrium_andersonii.AAC.1